MKYILITGANGFIGKSLCGKFKKLDLSYIPFTSKDGDLSQINSLDNIDFSKISCIIHTAAKTFVPDSWLNPDLFLKNNINSTITILEKCKIHKIPLIFLSAYIYDSNNNLPINENSKLKGFNPYALSKKLSEEICEFYSNEFDIPITILRPFNIYGEFQNKLFLIPSLITQAIRNNKVEVESLNTKRDYVHVDDLVEACICAISKFSGFQTFNIGSGFSYSILDIVSILEKISKNKIEILNKNISRKNEIYNVIADITNAKNILKWSPKITFDEGIETMYFKLKQLNNNGN